MDLQLKGKVIVVSGGAKGIGEGIVRVLANEDAIPVVIGRNKEDNQKLMNEIIASGKKCDEIVAELTKPEECERAIKEVKQKFGRIDGLVNNAGVNDGVGLENGNYEKFIESLHRK